MHRTGLKMCIGSAEAVHGRVGSARITDLFIRRRAGSFFMPGYKKAVYTQDGVQLRLVSGGLKTLFFTALTDYVSGLYTLYTGLMVTTTMYINKNVLERLEP